jgi:hypothetical protein
LEAWREAMQVDLEAGIWEAVADLGGERAHQRRLAHAAHSVDHHGAYLLGQLVQLAAASDHLLGSRDERVRRNVWTGLIDDLIKLLVS